MKKLLVTTIAILVLLLYIPAVSAQTALKMGYVDIQKVIFVSETGKQAINQVKIFQETRQKEITKAEAELNELEKALSKQLFSLTDDAKAEKDEEIRAKKLLLKRLLEDSEYELNKRKKEVLSQINSEIVILIQKLGKDEGYGLILEVTGSNIIYGDQAYDLTDKVISLYDKK